MQYGNMEGNASRVELGLVVATPRALETLEKVGIEPDDLLRRHQAGDWGDVPPEDAEMNECGPLVMSSYPIVDATIWVITNRFEGATTLLLPEEY